MSLRDSEDGLSVVRPQSHCVQGNGILFTFMCCGFVWNVHDLIGNV